MSVEAAPPAQLFVVRNQRGGPWRWDRPLREQEGWQEHAQFMDALVDDGLILLGGPIEGDRQTLLVFKAPSREAVLERLADDPWAGNGMLSVASIESWTILLCPPEVDGLIATALAGS